MARAYNVIDSDGHILEPVTLWNDYMDPAFRHRAPKLVIDKDGRSASWSRIRSSAASRGWAASAGSARDKASSRPR